jgi:hypothetical protein
MCTASGADPEPPSTALALHDHASDQTIAPARPRTPLSRGIDTTFTLGLELIRISAVPAVVRIWLFQEAALTCLQGCPTQNKNCPFQTLR